MTNPTACASTVQALCCHPWLLRKRFGSPPSKRNGWPRPATTPGCLKTGSWACSLTGPWPTGSCPRCGSAPDRRRARVHPDGSPMLGILVGFLLVLIVWAVLAALAYMAVVVIVG